MLRLSAKPNRSRVEIRMASEPISNNQSAATAWSPFVNPVFRALWIATLVSNIGTWMHDIGAGWLMTSLSPSPVMVALVQTATTLPLFLLALPAGALADIIDRRRHLIIMQCFLACIAATLAFVSISGVINAWTLLALTFAMGAGSAMMLPAWAAIVPELVTRKELSAAIALNSMGINVARAIGPALAGIIISQAGSGAVFTLNAISYAGVILVLARWQRVQTTSTLPAERMLEAMRSGLRFARHSPELRAALVRGFGFIIFASASWALLPLIAKNLVNGGPQAFGVLVACIGAGAVAGALLLPRLRAAYSQDVLVAAATLIYSASLVALGTFDRLWPLTLAMAASGTAWITVLSTLQVSAQLALPNWVRSRGLAVFMAVFMGSMAAGSLLWGKLAELMSIEHALLIAAAGAVASVPLTWRWRVSETDTIDLAPSMHWPTPLVQNELAHDRGPVLVTITYHVRPENTQAFLACMTHLGRCRRRDGAFAWGVYEDVEQTDHLIEAFNDESWLAHLRQHERVTEEIRALQNRIQNLLVDGASPVVRHYVAPESKC